MKKKAAKEPKSRGVFKVGITPPMLIKHRKKAGKAQSEAMRASRVDKKTVSALVLTGIGPGKLVTISPARFHLLDVNMDYQRDRINDSVWRLIDAMQHGGHVPDPITVCQRSWLAPGEKAPSDKLWIIDGQQRTFAAMELDVPLKAMQHSSDSLVAERDFFLVMNRKTAVNAQRAVWSWSGPGAVILREKAANEDHSLFGRISFKGSGGVRAISAAAAIRAMISAATGNKHAGDIQKILGRLDHAINHEKGAKERSVAILDLLGRVFPNGGCRTLPAFALGLVGYARFTRNGPALPTQAVIQRLSRINWLRHCPGWGQQYRPMVMAAIERIWR